MALTKANLANIVEDTLPVANGGTGVTTLASGRIPYGAGTSALASSSTFVFDGTNLGVGTASPAYDLQVSKTVAAGSVISNINNPSSTGAARLYLGNDAGASTAYFQVFGSSHAVKPSVVNLGSNESYPLVFDTAGTERMRIDSSGNLTIGKTTTSPTTAGIVLGKIGDSSFTRADSTNGDVTLYVYSTGAAAARFYVGMGGTVFATSTTISAISDQRLKENIQDIDIGLDAVMQLKPRKFDWKDGKGKNIKGDRGWVAQEFETIFPEMVNEWADPAPEGEAPYKSVAADLIPVLVKAIQEQQLMIETLTTRLTALEAK
jgi:hypothetical protein